MAAATLLKVSWQQTPTMAPLASRQQHMGGGDSPFLGTPHPILFFWPPHRGQQFYFFYNHQSLPKVELLSRILLSCAIRFTGPTASSTLMHSSHCMNNTSWEISIDMTTASTIEIHAIHHGRPLLKVLTHLELTDLQLTHSLYHSIPTKWLAIGSDKRCVDIPSSSSYWLGTQLPVTRNFLILYIECSLIS